MSVMQQAILGMALSLFSAVTWSAEPLFLVRSAPAFGLWLTLISATVMATFIASVWISYDLRTGIESERWPEQQIERFRAIFHSRLVVGAHTTLAFAAMLFFCFDLLSQRHRHWSAFGLLLLSQNLSQVLMAGRRTSSAGQHIDWRSASPITSDHWGGHG